MKISHTRSNAFQLISHILPMTTSSRFPRSCVRGFPSQGTCNLERLVFIFVNLNKLLNKQSNYMWFNTLRPRQNCRRFADDTFKRIFLNENVRISIKISLKFVPKGPINNNPALVQIMAWRRSGDKPLSEPMMVSLMTHICVTRPQWVKMQWRSWDVTVMFA